MALFLDSAKGAVGRTSLLSGSRVDKTRDSDGPRIASRRGLARVRQQPMTPEEIAEQTAIRNYLRPYDGTVPVSCLDAALGDARTASLRDRYTGAPTDERHSTSWLGAVGYLILIDQIGGTLRLATETEPPPGNPFRRCLRRFTKLNDEEIETLYGLRCALAHDFGLFNPPDGEEGPEQRHRVFTLDPGAPGLIVPPPIAWDGKVVPAPDPRQHGTRVNTKRLAQLVEDIVRKLRHLPVDALRVDSGLKDGWDELQVRYSFMVFPG